MEQTAENRISHGKYFVSFPLSFGTGHADIEHFSSQVGNNVRFVGSAFLCSIAYFVYSPLLTTGLV